MAKGRGGGKTPARVIELLNKVVTEKGQSAVSREAGLTRQTVQRYLVGIGEPTQETLEKLASYFGVAVGWLRGDIWAGKHGGIDLNDIKPLAICAECGKELVVSPEGFFRILPDGTEDEGDGIYRVYPCENCCKKE